MLAALVNGAIWLGVFSSLPVYSLHCGLIQNQAMILLTAYVLGNLGFQLPLGRLLDRWSAPLVLAICGIFQVIGAVALPFVIREGTLAWLAMAIWGGTLGGIYIAGLTLLGRSFTTAQLTGAASAQTIAFESGAILGPLLTGLGLHAWNPNGMLIVICAAGTVLAYLGLRMHITARHLSSA
jgi:MFS family permease